MVDHRGLLVTASLTPANLHDSVGVVPLLKSSARYLQGKTILADKAYRGSRLQNIASSLGAIMKTKKDKRRYVVERSFAWMNGYRRQSKIYERTFRSSLFFIYFSFLSIILRR